MVRKRAGARQWAADLCQAFTVAVDAGQPQHRLDPQLSWLVENDEPPTAIIALGKAAVGMARSCRRHGLTAPGIIITNPENADQIEGMRCFASGHPIPDETGLQAAETVIRFVGNLGPADHLLLLISGGGSALLPAPAKGITLDDKIRLNTALLESGLDIHRMNSIRRLFSRLKGGRLARLAAPARITQMLLSDVPGDILASIASGPALPAPEAVADAVNLIRQAGLDRLEFVQRQLQWIEAGTADLPVAADDPLWAGVTTTLLAGNTLCQQAASRWLAAYPSLLETPPPLAGEAVTMARQLAQLVRQHADITPRMLVCGGETTVTLSGSSGLGGRSQELGLAFMLAMQEVADAESYEWAILAGGTDGRDGPTDAAGSLLASDCVFDSRLALAALAGHDSYQFLDSIGGLLKIPPTGTNLADLVLCVAARRS